jgi:predicted phosphodiesterase
MPSSNRFSMTELALKYVDDFPAAATRTLARMMYKDHPRVFLSIERARAVVRRIRGSAGDRPTVAKAKQRSNPKVRSTGYPSLPKPVKEVEDWRAFDVEEPGVTAVFSDIHIPFHDPQALEETLKVAKKRKVNTIILNGDIVDFYAVSRWEQNPEIRDLNNEIMSSRQFLAHLRGRFPDARIIYKEGNHENRWTSYMTVHAPEFLAVDSFKLHEVLKLTDLGIELISDLRPISLGKLSVIHGHEYARSVFSPVNPARGLFLRGKTTAMCGHHHQVSQHSERTLEGKQLSTWSLGCLCNLNPQYMPLNNWSHGFAIVDVESSGDFHVDNIKIVNGKSV